MVCSTLHSQSDTSCSVPTLPERAVLSMLLLLLLPDCLVVLHRVSNMWYFINADYDVLSFHSKANYTAWACCDWGWWAWQFRVVDWSGLDMSGEGGWCHLGQALYWDSDGGWDCVGGLRELRWMYSERTSQTCHYFADILRRVCCFWKPGPTQPGHSFVGGHSEYQQKLQHKQAHSMMH